MGLHTLQVAVLLLVITAPGPSSARHLIVGTSPSFLSDTEPEDKVIHENILHDASGTMANLLLTCAVTGDPTPTVTWYREVIDITGEGIQTNNTLALNVTEDNGASRDGVLYHCRATNNIGPKGATITATIRSRDARVTYAYFEGFQGAISTVNVEVVQGSVVALECTVPKANPKPMIRWADKSGIMITSSGTSLASLEEDGRYLYLTELDVSRLGTEYHCEVTNVRITETVRSQITYTLSNTLNISTLVMYKPIGDLVGRIGESVNFVYVAGYKTMSVIGDDGVNLRCHNAPPLMYATSNNRIRFTVPQPVDGNNVFNITCEQITADGAEKAVMGTLTIVEPAAITSPVAGDATLTVRDVIVGGSRMTYTCESKGLPTPTLSWYYNGGPISASPGVIENGKVLTIPTPAISNSGIYQCFVTNVLEGEVETVQRAWILEVRAPRTAIVRPFSDTNPMAIRDRLVEILLVLPINTIDLILTAEVNSDPCPKVKWRLNGTDITSSDSAYSFDNPCSVDSAVSPYNFTLTISVLTMSNSGFYSATFNNGYSSPTSLPQFFVTIPVDVELLGISLEVVDEPSASCLLSGSDVTLTCEIVGYPRPLILFSIDSIVIDPSMNSRIASGYYDQITIYGVVESDTAVYTCEARPADGVLINEKRFQYCTKPVIISITSTDDIKEGKMFKIVCNIDGIPLPNVTWLKDNLPLSEAKNQNLQTSSTQDGKAAILTIMHASMVNNGQFTCVASNLAATVNMTIDVQIKATGLNQIIYIASFLFGGLLVSILLGVGIRLLAVSTRKTKKKTMVQPMSGRTTI